MPKKVRNIVIIFGTLIFSTVSILLSVSTNPPNAIWKIVVYTVYAFAAGFLSMSIWLLVCFLKEENPREKIRVIANKTKLTSQIYDNYAFRTIFVGHISLFSNVFFSITKGAIGLYYSSIWLCVLAIYYLFLCIAKSFVLKSRAKTDSLKDFDDKRRLEWKIYRICGFFLIALTLSLQGVIILIVEQGNSFVYHGYLIFVVAMYDFYSLISSIIFMVKTRKKHNPIVVSIKTIRFATSMVAMLTLQTAMFASFGSDMDIEMQTLMNILTGTAVCIAIIISGTVMVFKANNELCKMGREHEK